MELFNVLDGANTEHLPVAVPDVKLWYGVLAFRRFDHLDSTVGLASRQVYNLILKRLVITSKSNLQDV